MNMTKRPVIEQILEHLGLIDECWSEGHERVEFLKEVETKAEAQRSNIDKLKGYRNTWVPEDCAYLPWIPPVRAAIEAGAIGDLQELQLFRSAYAYHGLATAKAVLGESRVVDGRRHQAREGLRERHIQLGRGHRALIVEPRDYALGHIRVLGSAGGISDQRDLHPGDLHIEVETSDATCRAIRVGDHIEHLSEAEASLTEGDEAGTSVIARQEAMKRVGLLRLLCDVHAGKGGYPLEQAVDDMVIDYYLEKLGRYVSTPITNPRSALARGMLKIMSRLGG